MKVTWKAKGVSDVPEINWNEQADYLIQTRGLYLNDDYLEFLVRRVWKLEAPMDLVDFGCGLGYMGLKLLPLLPEGSSYTGLDLAGDLLTKARDRFGRLPYRSRFLEADVTTFVQDEGRYDAAVCHALLLHIPNPLAVLDRMRRCVKPGGLVICIEPHWLAGTANTYYHGARQSSYARVGTLQQLWEEETARTGKDGNIGLKLPVYMDQVGLVEVGCRLSDKVNLLLPHQDLEERNRLLERMRWEGYGSAPAEAETMQKRLIDRGLSPAEARAQYEAEYSIYTRYAKYGSDLQAVYATGMMISFGRVPA